MDQVMGHEFSVKALRRIDVACDSFEDAWRSGAQPRIEDYLLRCEVPERPRLLESLQKLQQELILTQLTGRSPSGARQPTPPVSYGRSSMSQPIAQPEETVDWDGPRVSLRVIEGPHRGEEFMYDEHNTLLVGRSLQAQLRLKDDPHFSRHHFRLELNPPTCYLMDLRSRNGTMVNGERVSERFLQDGDVVSGGRTKIAVSIQQPGMNAIPPRRPAAVARPTKPVAAPRRPASSPPEVVFANAAPADDGADLSEEVQIGGYRIHEQIGDGDLGTVYRATRLSSGEVCALKVIAAAEKTDEKAVQTFLREASILNQLDHPYIVRMIEMGAAGSDLFLSTEFVDAIPWSKLVANSSTAQRIRIACGLMSQILSALDYAHSRSMVHRDVKPGNILISRTNGKLTAKLADFGLAKQYANAGMSQVTRAGDVIGSLPYMSPEQFINSREARPACDLYSAGATLYWMLTGHDPIELENHPCKFLAILEDAPVPIQQHCPEIPAALAHLVHRALEKTPEKRFQSAAEMRQQLRAFIK